jgi:hypothetical protein
VRFRNSVTLVGQLAPDFVMNRQAPKYLPADGGRLLRKRPCA